MTKAPKKIIVIILSIVVIVSCIFLYVKSRKFNIYLKTVIRKEISKYIGQPVEIDRIRTEFFNSIVLNGVRVTHPQTCKELLSIRKIKINYSLVKLIKKIGSIPQIIRSISFYDPQLTIHHTSTGTIVSGFEKVLSQSRGTRMPGIPPWKLNFVNGRISIYSDGNSVILRDFDGSVYLGGYPEIHLLTSFEIEKLIKELKVEGKLHVIKQDFKMWVTGKNLHLKHIGEIPLLSQKFSFDSGLCGIQLRVEGNVTELKKDYKSIKVNGEIKAQNVLTGPFKIPSLCINMSPDRLKIEQCSLIWNENSVDIAGMVKNYLKIPEIMLTAKGKLSARHLLNKFRIKNLQGEFQVDGVIEGSPDNLTVRGNLYMDSGTISMFDINRLKTAVSYEQGILKFESGSVNIAGGSLMWEGDYKPEGEISVRLMADRLDMAKITKFVKMNGKISGDTAISGNLKSPKITTNLTVENFTVPGRKFEHITIKAEYDNLKLTLNGFSLDGDYNTSGEFHISEDIKKIYIDKFTINGPDREKVKLGGGFTVTPFSTNLAIEATDVNTVDIPGLRKIYPDLEGLVNFKGNFRYNKEESALNGSIHTAEMSIWDEKYFLACDIDALIKNQTGTLKISNINLNNYLQGLLEFEKVHGKTVLKKSSITLTAASIKELTVLAKKNFDIGRGILDGTFYVSENKGEGKFSIQNLNAAKQDFGNINCQIAYSPDEIRIKELIAQQQRGSFTVSGKMYPGQDIEVEFKDYDLNKRKIAGIVSYKGGYGNDGKYEFDVNGNLKLNENKWPRLILNGSYDGGELKVKLAAQDRVKGELLVKFGGNRTVEGEIWLKEFGLQKILDAMGVSFKAQGLTSGSIGIMGKSKSPLFYFQGCVNEGRWHDIPVSMTGAAEYHSGELNIEKLKGRIGEDGDIEITGGIDKNNIKSSVEIKNFDISMLKEKFKGIDTLGGTLYAKADISGAVSKPVMDIKIDVDNFNLNKFVLKKIKGILSYSGKTINVKELEAFYNDGVLNLTDGKIDLAQPGKLKVNLPSTFKNIGMGPISILGQGRIKGEINTAPVSLRLKIIPYNLLINRFILNTELMVEYTRRTLNIKAEEGIEGQIYFNPTGSIEVSTIKMSKDDKIIEVAGVYTKDKISADIHVENIEINKIIKLLDSNVEYHGSASLDLKIDGSLKNIHAEGQLSVNKGRYKNIRLDSFSMEFSYSDGSLTLDNTTLKDPRFIDIEAAGRISRNSDLNVSINRFSLSVLEDISGEISKAAGYFKGKFKLKGTISKPLITGGINLEGGTITGKNIIGKIRDIECKIDAEQSRFRISKLKAKWKPGSVTGMGYVDIGVRPVKVNLTLVTEGEKPVAVKIPYLNIPQSSIFGRYLTLPSHGEPKGKIKFYDTDEGYYLKGDITLTNTHFTYPPKKGSKKTPSSTFLDDIIIDIDIKAGESVWYENTYARVKVNGSLNFKQYPGKSIIINGLITSNEGEITYFNRYYKVKEANLRFDDTVEYLDAVATTDITRKIEDMDEDDVIEMIITQSRVSDIVPRFNSSRFSDKTSSEDAMALTLTIDGVELEKLTQEERNALLRREILRAIDANLTSPLVKNILKRADFIDVAKIDVKVRESLQDARTFMLEGAGLELGRYFTDKFYMGYYMEVGGVENKLRLFHELDVLYRLQGSQFIRGRISEKDKFFLGVEQRIRF